MSTTEKLRLLAFKKKEKKDQVEEEEEEAFFWQRKILLRRHTWYIYLAASEVSHATRNHFKKVKVSNKTN